MVKSPPPPQPPRLTTICCTLQPPCDTLRRNQDLEYKSYACRAAMIKANLPQTINEVILQEIIHFPKFPVFNNKKTLQNQLFCHSPKVLPALE